MMNKSPKVTKVTRYVVKDVFKCYLYLLKPLYKSLSLKDVFMKTMNKLLDLMNKTLKVTYDEQIAAHN